MSRDASRSSQIGRHEPVNAHTHVKCIDPVDVAVCRVREREKMLMLT